MSYKRRCLRPIGSWTSLTRAALSSRGCSVSPTIAASTFSDAEEGGTKQGRRVPRPEGAPPVDAALLDAGKAIEHLVAFLPPKERAAILLKDVFDYSLEEIAEL